MRGLTTTHCNNLQHTATHCLSPSRYDERARNVSFYCKILQHNYNTLQHTVTCSVLRAHTECGILLQNTATQQQHTATHCHLFSTTSAHGMWKRTATHCNTLQHTTTHCDTLSPSQYDECARNVEYYCNTLQDTTRHCNILSPSQYDERVRNVVTC